VHIRSVVSHDCDSYAPMGRGLPVLQTPQRRASHSEATTVAWKRREQFSFFHGPHGKRRPAPNGFAAGDGAPAVEPSSAVTTRSPSFKPSTTSVIIPSLIPVLICLGCGRLAPVGKTYTVR